MIKVLNPDTEKALLAKIAEGDEAAFRALFHHYVPKLHPIIFKIVRSETVVKDVIQDVFLALWKDRGKLPEIVEPSYWIYRIAYNLSYSQVKEQIKTRKSLSAVPVQEWSEVLPDNSERIDVIQHAIKLLPEQSQRIFRMNKENGQKISEIANELDIAPQSVKNSLHRSVKQIREYLAGKDVLLPSLLFIFLRQ